MLRKCNVCGVEAHQEDELSIFVNAPGCKYGKRNICTKCHYQTRKHYDKNRIRNWKTKHQVWKRYHCTPEEYEERMSTSKSCEVCGVQDNLCYDHDHTTMEFRGVLCRSCNRSIGQLGDTEEALMKALNYLRRNK